MVFRGDEHRPEERVTACDKVHLGPGHGVNSSLPSCAAPESPLVDEPPGTDD